MGEDLVCEIFTSVPQWLWLGSVLIRLVLTVVVDLLLMFIVTLAVPNVCGCFMVGPHFVMQYLLFSVLHFSCLLAVMWFMLVLCVSPSRCRGLVCSVKL